MSATITFAVRSSGDPSPLLSILVEETAAEIYEKWTAARAAPLLLTQKGETQVFVNPATIAYWRDE